MTDTPIAQFREGETPDVPNTRIEAAAKALVTRLRAEIESGDVVRAGVDSANMDDLLDLCKGVEDAIQLAHAAAMPVPALLEVTGNVPERELAARYVELKAKGARHYAGLMPSHAEQFRHLSDAFEACATDFRAGLHLPEIELEGHVIPYNESNDTGLRHASAVNALVTDIHARNVKAGWWHNIETGEPLERNVGELICLMHSELSEAMEGHRKGLADDKLPHRPMIEVEFADCVIRIADAAGGLGLDLGGAIDEKLAFNASRPDHQLENRLAEGGKKY